MTTATKPKTKPTELYRVEQAVIQGTTVPVEALPIPTKTKDLMVGKDTLTILKEAAPHCAQYLFNCLISKRFKPSWARIDVAKYVIDQVVGKAKIRAEITGAGGAPLTWLGVVNLFAQVEDAQRLARAGKPLPELPLVVAGEVESPEPETSKVAGGGNPGEKEPEKAL